MRNLKAQQNPLKHWAYISYKHSISYFQPLVLPSAPIAYKDSSKVNSKTLQRRSNFVKNELSICSGNDGTNIQAAHLIQSFGRGERESCKTTGKYSTIWNWCRNYGFHESRPLYTLGEVEKYF